MTRFTAAMIALILLAACGSPAMLQSSQSVSLPRPPVAAAQAAKPEAAPTSKPAATGEAQGAHTYEGDRDNSITVKAGDVVTIHNPDFSRGYTFAIVSITEGHITVSTNEPNVTIRDNGGKMPIFFHSTESYAKGVELPIGWARFTPREKTPVVQTYSMQPGASVARGQDDG